MNNAPEPTTVSEAAPVAQYEPREVQPLSGLIPATPDGNIMLSGLQDMPQAAATGLPEQTAGRTARLNALNLVDVLGNDVGAEVMRMTEQYRDLIQINGDRQVRLDAALASQKEDYQALTGLMADDQFSDIREGAKHAAARVIQEDVEERAEYALEKRAIERIQELAAKGDKTQAKVLMNTLEQGDADTVITENHTKMMILQREIEKAQIDKAAQPWFRDAMDFVLAAVPFNASAGFVGNVDVEGIQKQWYDNLFAGERRQNERSGLWNLPAAEFSKYVREQLIPQVRENSTLFGYTDQTERLSIMAGLASTPDAIETNTYNAIDNLGAIPFGKITTGLTSMMVKNGARKEAAGYAAHAAEIAAEQGPEAAVRATGVEIDEVFESISPSAVNPEPSLSVGVSSDANAAIERAQRLMADVPEMLPSDRWANEGEKSAAVAKTVERLTEEYGRDLKDWQAVDVPLSNNSSVTNIELTIGTKEGGGYATAKAAKRWMSNAGETGTVVQDESGQWFVKLTKNMSETGFYNAGLAPGKGNKFAGLGVDNPIAQVLLSARQVGDKLLADQAQAGGNKLNKVLKALTKPLEERINTADHATKQRVSGLLIYGERKGEWMDPDQLNILFERQHGRPMNDKELDVYQAARDVNDIEFMLRNDDTYMQKHTKGFETVSIPFVAERKNALVTKNPERAPPTRVYDTQTGTHYHKGDLDEQKLALLKGEGRVLVTLEDAITTPDGSKVKTFLTPLNDLKIEPLRRDQIAYRAGGHRFYEGKYFSKQGRKAKQPDTGEEFLESPLTHINGTKAEVSWWNIHMEKARLAAKEMMEDTGLIDSDWLDDHILMGQRGLPTGEEFVKMAERGDINLDEAFETLYDREMPKGYDTIDPEAALFNPNEDGMNGYLRSQGRMYYSGKGEVLKDWRGDSAPTLDPFEAINRSLKNIANISSFADYKLSAVERWVKTFKEAGVLTGYDPMASDVSTFATATINKRGANYKNALLADKQRKIVQRTIGWQTDFDVHVDHINRSIMDWVGGPNPDGARNWLSKNATNWWDNHNPVQSLRGLAFDMKMGFFNVAQLPLQAATLSVSMALSPKHGAQGFMNYLPMRAYLSKSGTEHMLDTLIERGTHTMAGFTDPKEYKAFMRSTKKSGFMDVGGTHQMVNSYGPNAAASNIGSGITKLREHGRFFFNEGEMINRGVAANIAWKETREKLPSLGTDSTEFLRHWQGRAEEYSLSMSKQSGATWQHGLLSIPTQFWAYQSRIIEAMLGSTFTPAQKARLIISQSILYGAAGVPLAPLVMEKIKNSSGEAPEIGSFQSYLDRGLTDNLIYTLTGTDALVSKRFGTGSWLTDTVKDMFGLSAFGKKSFAEVVVGATGNITGDVAVDLTGLLSIIARHATAESGEAPESLDRDTVVKLFTNISTLSNLHKAYMAWAYGNYVTNKGQTLGVDVPKGNAAFIMLFGAQPGVQEDLSAKSEFLKDKGKAAEEAAKVFGRYRTDMLNHPERAPEIAREMGLYSALLPDDIRQKAIGRVPKHVDPSLYDGLVKRFEREQSRKAAIEALQE